MKDDTQLPTESGLTDHAFRRLPSLAGRHLSFTEAAKELCVTQGAVSRMIHTLEQELGVPLFHRSGNTLKLTAFGSAYHAQIAESLRRLAHAASSVRRMAESEALSVSVPPTFAQRWMIPRMLAFQQRHPDVSVKVSVTTRYVDLFEEQFDLAVRYETGEWPDLDAIPLMRYEHGVYCSPALLEASPRLHSPPHLYAQRLLQHTDAPGIWEEYFAAAGLEAPDTKNLVALEHEFLVVEAAVAGMGLALLSPLFIKRELDSGLLVQPFPRVMPCRLSYYLVHLPNMEGVRKIQLFKRWALSEARVTPTREKKMIAEPTDV